jgi:protoporphyrinogen oxidase
MSTFRYPERGGFQSYSGLLERGSSIQFHKRLVNVNFSTRQLTFADGTEEFFEMLISTLPVTELIRMTVDCPNQVQEAARKLVCTSHFLVSLGINRPDLSNAYWTYYYDEDLPFSRLSFPYKYSPYAAPVGCSSVQAEIVHSRFRPLSDRESIVDRCVDGLLRCGLLKSKEEIIFVDARDITYANVVFNFDRAANLAIVHGYLKEQGVEYCGRFGDWEYLWTDQSILSGERAGKAVRRSFNLPEREFDAA